MWVWGGDVPVPGRLGLDCYRRSAGGILRLGRVWGSEGEGGDRGSSTTDGEVGALMLGCVVGGGEEGV